MTVLRSLSHAGASLALASLALVATRRAGTSAVLNPAPNPSREDPAPDGSPVAWRPEVDRAEVDARLAHGGAKSLKVVANGASAPAGWISAAIPLAIGQSFELSGW